MPGCRARKSNSEVATSAPRGQVVPEGRARKSRRRVTTARTGTVQNVLVGSVCIRGSLRYWGGRIDEGKTHVTYTDGCEASGRPSTIGRRGRRTASVRRMVVVDMRVYGC